MQDLKRSAGLFVEWISWFTLCSDSYFFFTRKLLFDGNLQGIAAGIFRLTFYNRLCLRVFFIFRHFIEFNL